MHYAAEADSNVSSMFLTKKSSRDMLNHKDAENNTPLGLAVFQGNLNFATSVLLAGGDFNQPVFEYLKNDRDAGESPDYWFFKFKHANNNSANSVSQNQNFTYWAAKKQKIKNHTSIFGFNQNLFGQNNINNPFNEND